MLKNNTIFNDLKIDYEFCTSFGLQRYIKVQTSITCNSSIIVDHLDTLNNVFNCKCIIQGISVLLLLPKAPFWLV